MFVIQGSASQPCFPVDLWIQDLFFGSVLGLIVCDPLAFPISPCPCQSGLALFNQAVPFQAGLAFSIRPFPFNQALLAAMNKHAAPYMCTGHTALFSGHAAVYLGRATLLVGHAV